MTSVHHIRISMHANTITGLAQDDKHSCYQECAFTVSYKRVHCIVFTSIAIAIPVRLLFGPKVILQPYRCATERTGQDRPRSGPNWPYPGYCSLAGPLCAEALLSLARAEHLTNNPWFSYRGLQTWSHRSSAVLLTATV